MRAAIRNSLFGFHLAFTSDQPEPSFNPAKDSDCVLVKVKASAINPVDYKLPKAIAGPVVGIDFCGTIIQVGDNVKDFQVNDVVFGGCKSGSLAEQTVAKSEQICKVPSESGWKPTECAALPVAYESALQGLRKGNIVDNDKSNENKSVLVIGASGGTGLAALQLCKAMGISRIVAICSSKNKDLVLEYGATEFVDYTNETALKSFFESETNKFDCVFDVATNSGGGEDYVAKSIPLLRKRNSDNQKEDGQYVALNGPASSWLRYATGFEKSNQHIILCQHNTKDQQLILQLLDSIKAKPLLNEMSFNENDVKQGFDLLHSRRTKGKIVFSME